ncbi:PQQ-dependent sugar dehydrogenase [Fictibacillus sp. WQ 8-8]|uniref:PQQ-dependent sugar dehydrogenase n=1 Tax=Fictibacillus sp. WQ 8-8 TaxID=2938788 RepID=UPI00210B0CF1|nr:PQQ-dependent sugar dehydrogenase [Fictibacillus sp. WQ 8-8]MCQ6268191.1 PQQ-dependent sugar dehydrogenase [Fictibacillus sp. WQ 8-8]
MFVLKWFIFTLMSILLISGCSQENKNTSEKNEKDAKEVLARQAEVIATDLEIPWNINKQDNTFYMSQRPGYIIQVNGDSGSKTVQNVEVTKKVLHEGEGGLLGFILAPDFKTSQEAIAYHTYQQDGTVLNRIIVLKLNGNTWTERRIILERIPGGTIHNGGRMKIGPDGKLYATAGDAGNPENAQNIQSLGGKILRMQLDGRVPNDNPFKNSYVHSYGHRNPQGLAWDDEGKLYSSEHGQAAHDEINLIEPGKNYGWPIIEGNQQAPNMISPLYQSGDDTWAPSGIAIKNNKMYVANLRGESIQVFDLTDKTVIIFFENAGRMRDVLIEGNTLYTITNNRDGRGNPREGDDKLFKLPLE